MPASAFGFLQVDGLRVSSRYDDWGTWNREVFSKSNTHHGKLVERSASRSHESVGSLGFGEMVDDGGVVFRSGRKSKCYAHETSRGKWAGLPGLNEARWGRIYSRENDTRQALP